ncbi:hypothetical protein K438DRAFT_1926008 [Mycena galopus ATCC 62051]|nr:hypothetical protein K438DRAFT_1926008 [Mycena galopus ATCC 62051]
MYMPESAGLMRGPSAPVLSRGIAREEATEKALPLIKVFNPKIVIHALEFLLPQEPRKNLGVGIIVFGTHARGRGTPGDQLRKCKSDYPVSGREKFEAFDGSLRYNPTSVQHVTMVVIRVTAAKHILSPRSRHLNLGLHTVPVAPVLRSPATGIPSRSVGSLAAFFRAVPVENDRRRAFYEAYSVQNLNWRNDGRRVTVRARPSPVKTTVVPVTGTVLRNHPAKPTSMVVPKDHRLKTPESSQTTDGETNIISFSTPASMGDDSEPWIMFEGKKVFVPPMTISDFCHQYGINTSVLHLLEEAGFETAGALLDVTEDNLKDVGLQTGSIVEMKRALREFLSAKMRIKEE